MKNVALAALVSLALAFALAPAAANAQYKDQEYLDFVTKSGAPETIDWARLRALYVETSFYDPYGGAQSIWYGLQRLGQQVIDDPQNGSVKNYKDMLNRHFAHYRAHLQAIDLANKTGSAHINKAFHEAALKGILQAVRSSGDGLSPETAFRVIDPAEEQMILKTFHYTQKGQDFRQKDGHFWDVLKYVDPRTQKEGEMFFNVDTILAVSARR